MGGDKNGIKPELLLQREEKAEEMVLGRNRAPKMGKWFRIRCLKDRRPDVDEKAVG